MVYNQKIIIYEETNEWTTYIGEDYILMLHKPSDMKGTISFADDVLTWKQLRGIIPEFQSSIMYQVNCKLKENSE